MGKRKKKKSNTPRHKRLNRTSRLNAAKHWIPKYDGKNLVRGYSKHFAVDKLCAIKELEMLDYPVEPTYKKNLQDHANALQYKAEQKKKQETKDSWYEESDETFAYIAGYTSGGAPYGVTWEEWK